MECLDTGTMKVVLKQVGTAACDSDRLNMSVKTSTGPEYTSGYAIRASSFLYVDPAQSGTDLSGGKCEWLVVWPGCLVQIEHESFRSLRKQT